MAERPTISYIASMISRLLSALTRPAPTRLSSEDERLALAALLVRVARADNVYGEDEIARIDRVLCERYAMSPFEVTGLRALAEALERDAPDTVRFTRALKDTVPHEERLALLSAMWSVALSDGDRGAEEDALIRMVSNLLGISDLESALARKQVDRG
jgi:uncharacterized tellurite resistance protein B-like protein